MLYHWTAIFGYQIQVLTLLKIRTTIIITKLTGATNDSNYSKTENSDFREVLQID